MLVAVVLVDLALGLGLLALAALVRPLRLLGLRTRWRALGLLGLAAAVATIGLLWPAPDQHAETSTAPSRLDAIVPTWQFSEHHEIDIRATAEQVEAAIHQVTAREIRLFRALTWLRNPRLPGGRARESILAPPADQPILAVALRSGFLPLGEEPGRELVFGTLVIVPDAVRRLPLAEQRQLRAELGPERFATLSDPGYAKAVMNFRWTATTEGTIRLTTETRILATDAAARRRFGVYWRTIYPGSSLIRRTWLDAIRRRAEADRGTADKTD